jgi:hypothetical protein
MRTWTPYASVEQIDRPPVPIAVGGGVVPRPWPERWRSKRNAGPPGAEL